MNMPGLEIRRLDNAHDYRSIRLEALLDSPEAFGSMHAVEVDRPLAHFAERLTSSVIFAAYAGAQIVAMIGLKQEEGPKDSHKAFVWGFYVRPDYRKHGVGKALIVALMDAAHDIVEQLTLTVVRQNTSAIALYEACGFVTYGIEPRSLKEAAGYSDEVLMVRFLRQA